MKIVERIELFKEQIETEFGLNLAIIQAQKENKYPIERFKALCETEQDIKTTINEQVLTQWLIDNEVPENDWQDYAYFGDALYYRGEEVIADE